MESLLIDECYICAQPIETNSIRPCSNEKCSGRVHRSCIEEQYKVAKNQNELLCGNCKNPIIITTKYVKLHKTDCFIYYVKIAIFWSLVIGGSISQLCLAMGKSISTNIDKSCPFMPVPVMAVLVYLMVFTIMFMHSQLTEEEKNYSLVSTIRLRMFSWRFLGYMALALMGSSFFMITTHFIGSVIMSRQLETFFTCSSYAWGTFAYYIGIVCVSFGFIVYRLAKYCHTDIMSKFSTPELELGVEVEKTYLFDEKKRGSYIAIE